MALPNDIARCSGVGSESEGWREGCEDCLRRTSPADGDWVSNMAPPPIIAFECEYRIDPESQSMTTCASDGNEFAKGGD